MNLPNLDEMTDIEAMAWCTGEIARLSKERLPGSDPRVVAVLEWKKAMNKRLEENRKISRLRAGEIN